MPDKDSTETLPTYYELMKTIQPLSRENVGIRVHRAPFKKWGWFLICLIPIAIFPILIVELGVSKHINYRVFY